MAKKVEFVLGSVEVSVREATPAEAAAFAQAPTDDREAAREFVRYALSINAIRFEPEYPNKWFQTKIGRHSPYFFNSGLFSTARDIHEMAQAYQTVVEECFSADDGRPEVIYGPAYKGIQIADGLALALFLDWGDDYNLGVAFNRKEAKDHGEGGSLVGADMAGKRVLLVDDVITSGKSKQEGLDAIRGAGGVPIGCVIAFDRQEAGETSTLSAAQEFTQMTGLPLYAAATLQDLIDVLTEMTHPMLSAVLAYREQYGAG